MTVYNDSWSDTLTASELWRVGVRQTPANLDLYIESGVAYNKNITILDQNGAPLNLSSYSSVSVKVTRYLQEIDFFIMTGTITNAAAGRVNLQMASDETEKMKFDRYVYSLYLRNNTQFVKAITGQILIVNY